MQFSLRLVLSLPLLHSSLFYSFLCSFHQKGNPLSLLSPSLSLLFSCSPLNDKNARKEGIRGEWRPCSFLLLFQWMGEVGGVGSLPVDPPHASTNPSSRPIASVHFLAQTENENGFLYMFIVLPLVLYFTGKRTREEKDKNER